MNEENEGQQDDPLGLLNEIADWFGIARQILGDRAEELGIEEGSLRNLVEKWPMINPVIRKLGPVTSGSIMSYLDGVGEWFRAHDPADPMTWWNANPAGISISLYNTASTAAITGSGSYVEFSPEVEKVLEIFSESRYENERRDFVISKLENLAPEVAARFRHAWTIWNTAPDDAKPNAMIPMREAVNLTIQILSKPGQPFSAKNYADRRRARVRWIAANLVRDKSRRTAVEAASETFQRLYSKMSEMGKNLSGMSRKGRPLSLDAARSLLVQAQDLLHLILESIETDS